MKTLFRILCVTSFVTFLVLVKTFSVFLDLLIFAALCDFFAKLFVWSRVYPLTFMNVVIVQKEFCDLEGLFLGISAPRNFQEKLEMNFHYSIILIKRVVEYAFSSLSFGILSGNFGSLNLMEVFSTVSLKVPFSAV